MHKQDIIIGTQSRLKPEVANGELLPLQMSCCYNFFCRDRVHLTGNGVFIAVSSDLIIMLPRIYFRDWVWNLLG